MWWACMHARKNIPFTSTTHTLHQTPSQTSHSFSIDFFTNMITIYFFIVFGQLFCLTGKLELYLLIKQRVFLFKVRLLSKTLWGAVFCFCSPLRCFWEWHCGWKGVKAPFQTLHGIAPVWSNPSLWRDSYSWGLCSDCGPLLSVSLWSFAVLFHFNRH